MQTGYRDVVYRGHRLDGNCPFYDAIAANHSKVDLSSRRHRGFKDESPINVPTGEDRACITCDGEEKWLPMHMCQAHAITGVRQWFVFGEMSPWDPCRF